jgi:hypothetical protein
MRIAPGTRHREVSTAALPSRWALSFVRGVTIAPDYRTGLSGFGRTRRDERGRRRDRLLRLLGFLYFAVASLMTFGHFSSPVAWIAYQTAANPRHMELIAWLARPDLYAPTRTADETAPGPPPDVVSQGSPRQPGGGTTLLSPSLQRDNALARIRVPISLP